MIFLNELHERRFEELKSKSNRPYSDKERMSLFFIISGVDDLFNNVDELYDFENNKIILDFDDEGNIILDNPNLCSSANKLYKLGVQLYNGGGNQTVHDTFKFLDEDNTILVINALKIRYR